MGYMGEVYYRISRASSPSCMAAAKIAVRAMYKLVSGYLPRILLLKASLAFAGIMPKPPVSMAYAKPSSSFSLSPQKP